MKNAYRKDIWRSIKKTNKRFLSILIITALGVTVLTGIYAACQDMFRSADRFYDEQNLFDIRVLSTLGLTGEDVDALQAIEGIAVADGGYNETVHTLVEEVLVSADVVVLSAKGLNTPYVVEGALPQKAGEVAVTQSYLDASGKAIGDVLDIEEERDDEEDAADVAKDVPEPENADTAEAAKSDEDEELATDVDWDAEVDIEDESDKPTFLHTSYTITGVVIDPTDISNNEGVTAFRSTVTTDYTFFVTSHNVDTDVYTSVYLTLHGLAEMNCYSQEYEQGVQGVVDIIESQIMKQREKARYDAVMAEALEKLADAEDTMEEKFAQADELFSDAWEDIEEAKKELMDGEAELTREEKDALQKLADARTELEDGKLELQKAEEELAKGEKELEENALKLEEGKRLLAQKTEEANAGFAQAEALFAENKAQLDAGLQAAQGGVAQLQSQLGPAWPQAEWESYLPVAAQAAAPSLADPAFDLGDAAALDALVGSVVTATAGTPEYAALQAALAANGVPDTVAAGVFSAGAGVGVLQGGQQVLTAQEAGFQQVKADALAEMAAAQAELDEGEKLLRDGRKQLEEGKAKIAEGWKELAEGEEKLNEEEAKALRELADAWREIAEGKQELAEGEAELSENEGEYIEKKEEAQQKLDDAYADLQDIDMAQWYVQDRSSLDSYSSLKSDLSSIEAVGRAFPIVFLLVAILISLTTMTRMVEEERGLIGTYKALGFSDGAIYKKYLIYALLAAVLGGLLGDFLGFVALPVFLINILKVLYVIPGMSLAFDTLYGVGGVLLFVVSIVGATALACRAELRQTPAVLMRPKAPRAGARIFLERVPAVWNRLKFLNKVTARNLFRYKKRLFMTVLGIMGCTALVLAGFAIKDSVADLLPKQYEQINRYDLMLVADADDNGELLGLVNREEAITDYVNVQTETVRALNAAGAERRRRFGKRANDCGAKRRGL
ncbi:hypothetical protein LJB76_00330 [Clostridia bacterium OttesenSCG-928-O13]|nr:hypothetical protein [Clostridia bacterium OttesenSCG-928-O13]